MALSRVLEPEVMDTLEEATDYDCMDHSAVNRVFVDDLLDASRQQSQLGEGNADWLADDCHSCGILDLGTGTAQIPVELCARHPHCQIMAVDLSINMLDLARLNVEAEGLIERISLRHVNAKEMPLDDELFDVVMSNSIVHHIPDPSLVIAEAWRVLRPGGLLFFRDLLRPKDDATVRHLVETYAGEENDHQRQMFEDSLRAALTVDEVREMVSPLTSEPHITATTDRHWTWVATKR